MDSILTPMPKSARLSCTYKNEKMRRRWIIQSWLVCRGIQTIGTMAIMGPIMGAWSNREHLRAAPGQVHIKQVIHTYHKLCRAARTATNNTDDATADINSRCVEIANACIRQWLDHSDAPRIAIACTTLIREYRKLLQQTNEHLHNLVANNKSDSSSTLIPCSPN